MLQYPFHRVDYEKKRSRNTRYAKVSVACCSIESRYEKLIEQYHSQQLTPMYVEYELLCLPAYEKRSRDHEGVKTLFLRELHNKRSSCRKAMP